MYSYAEQIRNQSQELPPKPTETQARLKKLEGIKACIFDIYGTLFMSGCGDISLVEGTNRDSILKEVLGSYGFNVDAPELSDCFYGCIHKQQAIRREDGIDYPEVEIRDVWKLFLEQSGITDVNEETIERIAIDYECRVNPIWPMPNLEQSLQDLKSKGVLLGIVSNAQFFTPYLFESFTGKTVAAHGFKNDLSVYSYKLRIGKPSLDIYKPLIAALHERGIKAEEAIFVGNDLRNDVWPAQAMGMKGVLFAGDERSLRLREEDPRSKTQSADAVVTDLSQLIQLI